MPDVISRNTIEGLIVQLLDAGNYTVAMRAKHLNDCFLPGEPVAAATNQRVPCFRTRSGGVMGMFAFGELSIDDAGVIQAREVEPDRHGANVRKERLRLVPLYTAEFRRVLEQVLTQLGRTPAYPREVRMQLEQAVKQRQIYALLAGHGAIVNVRFGDDADAHRPDSLKLVFADGTITQVGIRYDDPDLAEDPSLFVGDIRVP